MTELTNSARLEAAAKTLRERGYPGDEHIATMLEHCVPIAIYWSQPYAAPFVPLLEAVLRYVKIAETAAEQAPTVPCDNRAHRDFVGDQDIRCELHAGHEAHRNGDRQWQP